MHGIWKDMFVLAVPILEKILRPICVYTFLVVGLRLSGKRELVQLNPFDLVVLLTLSNTVQNAIIGDDNTVTGGVIGATSLLIVNYLVVRFLYKHRGLDQFIEGRSDVLIEDGKIKTHNLKRELITVTPIEKTAPENRTRSPHEKTHHAVERGYCFRSREWKGGRGGGLLVWVKKQPPCLGSFRFNLRDGNQF